MRPGGVLLVILAAASCSSPHFGDGHLRCGTSNPTCPSGFYCAADSHCWLDDSGPPGTDLGGSSGDDLATPLDLASADLAPRASTCAGLSGVILCDGFENSLGLIGWTASGSNGLATRDTTHAYRGTASLHSHILGAPAMAGPFGLIHRSDIFPIIGILYARVWVYFSSGLPDSFEQFLNYADSGSTGFSVATDKGKVTNDNYAAGVYQSSATAMPLDRWACVQYEVHQASPTGPTRISIDGVLLSDLAQNGVTSQAANVSLGLDFYGNSAAIPVYDAWFDELIIDKNPTTCDE